MIAHPALEFGAKGMAALDLNSFTLAFPALGRSSTRPCSFLAAVSRSVPTTSGVRIQFPPYAGILMI
jgi:short subunit fatty acids transporter